MSESLLPVSHINIRQSISFVYLRLLFIEVLFAILIVSIHLPFSLFTTANSLVLNILSMQGVLFFSILTVKFILNMFVITAWINEYYEITPTKLIHRRGFIFKHEDSFQYTNIRKIMLQQGFIGKFLNYGSIEFLDYADKHYYTLYFIHNPLRYYRLLNDIVPNHDNVSNTIRQKIIETDTTP